MKCPDCAVDPGQLHQSGCDNEQCPKCGHQAIGCGCKWGKSVKRVPWSGENYYSTVVRQFGLPNDLNLVSYLTRHGTIVWESSKQRFFLDPAFTPDALKREVVRYAQRYGGTVENVTMADFLAWEPTPPNGSSYYVDQKRAVYQPRNK